MWALQGSSGCPGALLSVLPSPPGCERSPAASGALHWCCRCAQAPASPEMSPQIPVPPSSPDLSLGGHSNMSFPQNSFWEKFRIEGKQSSVLVVGAAAGQQNPSSSQEPGNGEAQPGLESEHQGMPPNGSM